ncbi:MAG: PIG-L deacetylase family protein [bacterium]
MPIKTIGHEIPFNFSSVKKALAVNAHPDDAEFFAGGTIAQLTKAGVEVTALYLTSGDKGNYALVQDGLRKGHGSQHTTKELVELRERDAKASNDCLGIKESIFLNMPDGGLVDLRSEMEEQICLLVRKLKPDLIFSFDPWKQYELHPDHRAIGYACLDALLAAENTLFHPEQLTAKLHPHKVPHVLLYQTDNPNLKVDISAEILKKINAVLAYSTQYLDPQATTKEITDYNAQLAVEANVKAKFIETFHYIPSL